MSVGRGHGPPRDRVDAVGDLDQRDAHLQVIARDALGAAGRDVRALGVEEVDEGEREVRGLGEGQQDLRRRRVEELTVRGDAALERGVAVGRPGQRQQERDESADERGADQQAPQGPSFTNVTVAMTRGSKGT
jgi:hypothetical protein